RADLELRLRVDQYSHIRAIARTNDNKLHMVSQYVKASGGCSAPSTANLEAAMQRLGKVRLQTNKVEHDGPALVSAQLRISHPNTTGMQRNQMTQLVYPAHFVRQVRVTLDGVEIFSADVGISISENPSFRFYLRDTDPRSLGAGGELIAEVFDSKENRFVKTAVLSQGS
ncbi:MAG: quinoprotein dehydrogenase-associated SoxYZ-like carrier, partial [Granulosicoccaceae bacterium]